MVMTDTGAQTTVVNGLAARSQTHDGVKRAHHPWAERFAPSDAPKPQRSHREPDVPRECVRCGKSFTVRPSQLKRGRGKYCSYSCMGKGGNKVRHEKPPTVQIKTLAPGTRVRVETTEAEIVRQSPQSEATVVAYLRESKTKVYSTWPHSVWVRVL